MCEEQSEENLDAEASFGRAFERFYTAMDDLVELLREAVPVVANQMLRWNDVRNIAPGLKIGEAKVDDFVAVWKRAFGTVALSAMVREPEPENGPEPTPGHSTAKQPEAVADYRQSVTDFIYAHGSFLDLQRVMRQYWRLPRHVNTMASSSVVFAVGALETVVADIERVRLRAHPGAGGTSDKEFSLDDLLRLGDIQAVVEDAIARRVESLCYGRLDDWNVWCRNAFKKELKDLALDWPELREIVQRRHVIAHNHGRVSRLYLERAGVEPSSLKVGDLLMATPEYMFRALEAVSVVGTRLLLLAWKKLGDEPDHMRTHVRNRGYDALVSERWLLALELSQALVTLSESGTSDKMIGQVNAWLARRGLGEDVKREVERWDVRALASRFQTAKAALLNDFDSLAALVPEAVKRRELSRGELLSWPLFKSLRAEAVFAGILSDLDASGWPGEVGDGGAVV
jgi:hypothetical protein